jgi:hypothetical protein
MGVGNIVGSLGNVLPTGGIVPTGGWRIYNVHSRSSTVMSGSEMSWAGPLSCMVRAYPGWQAGGVPQRARAEWRDDAQHRSACPSRWRCERASLR